MTKRRTFLISVQRPDMDTPLQVQGVAKSAQNACRLAFRKLIAAKLLDSAPKSDIDSPSTFEHTTVELIKDEV